VSEVKRPGGAAAAAAAILPCLLNRWICNTWCSTHRRQVTRLARCTANGTDVHLTEQRLCTQLHFDSQLVVSRGAATTPGCLHASMCLQISTVLTSLTAPDAASHCAISRPSPPEPPAAQHNSRAIHIATISPTRHKQLYLTCQLIGCMYA
jgi:hypothetical protein